MSAKKQLQAVARERVGKGAAREVRRQGQVPAVIYGGGATPQAIAIDFNVAKKLIFSGHFLTTVFDIEIGGKKETAIPRDYQLDVVKDTPLHIDFLRLSEGQEIDLEVPLHVTGQETSPGLKQGGTLQIVAHSIELTVPSNAIPDAIEVSVAELGIGDVVHLKDLALPKNAKTIMPGDTAILSIVGNMQDEAGADGAAEAAGAKE